MLYGSTTCRQAQAERLNRTWRLKISYFPQGFFRLWPSTFRHLHAQEVQEDPHKFHEHELPHCRHLLSNMISRHGSSENHANNNNETHNHNLGITIIILIVVAHSHLCGTPSVWAARECVCLELPVALQQNLPGGSDAKACLGDVDLSIYRKLHAHQGMASQQCKYTTIRSSPKTGRITHARSRFQSFGPNLRH